MKWISAEPITLDDLHALQRCVAGASGAGTLDDLATCYHGGDAAEVGLVCGCPGCREERGEAEARAGQSSASAGLMLSSSSGVSRPSDYSDDEDAAYAAYLRQTGRAPELDPTLNGRAPEPVPESTELLLEQMHEGRKAVAFLRANGRDVSAHDDFVRGTDAILRDAGYDVSEYAEEQTDAEAEAAWAEWTAFKDWSRG